MLTVRPPCKRCQGAQAVRPGRLCNKCFSETEKVSNRDVREVPLDQISLDRATQSRCQMDQSWVDELAELYADEVPLPPVIAFWDGKIHHMGDGFHRYMAKAKLGHKTILTDVRQGTQRDAILFSCGVNAHGKPRNAQDREKAVLTLLEDPEWSQWSNREIARRANVCNALVNKLRLQLNAAATRDDAPSENEGGRKYTHRSGSEATMKTERINRGRPARKEEDESTDSRGQSEPEIRGQDELGIALAGKSLEAFKAVADFRALELLARQMAREIDHLAHQRGGEHYRKELKVERQGPEVHFKDQNLGNCVADLKSKRPYASVCPYCWHEAKARHRDDCKACQGLGYVTRFTWDQAPPEYRQAVLAHFLESKEGKGAA